ncbi:PIN domain-containing protein [Mesorhizobium sp. BAC0120]|uniref:PIN domain-containing protein n=1 Tax=Mesorhizobium sp. BAC0120 TaxID=3090670 RepID=UPI00298CD292|nr:PIN domain-containing protein [Mesorhizobium sp. BAC0120]MDW6022303.1 PIN domain-containing protein [Mesorhizobium sp. BAC0120]
MKGRTFIDSNVFLYAAEKGALEKSHQAATWLRYLLGSGVGVANLQVMNEITNVLIKRGRMEAEEIFPIVDSYSLFGTTPLSEETVAAARLLHFETSFSWWDCLLLASAIELQCTNFLSEDLQDQRKIRGLTIINPFRHSPPQRPLH